MVIVFLVAWLPVLLAGVDFLEVFLAAFEDAVAVAFSFAVWVVLVWRDRKNPVFLEGEEERSCVGGSTTVFLIGFSDFFI